MPELLAMGLGKSARSVGLILRVGDQGLIPGTTWFTPAVLGVALNSYYQNLKWQVVQMGRCQGEGYRVVEGTTRHQEDRSETYGDGVVGRWRKGR